MAERFSDRHGYAPVAAEITVRHDAPDEFRGVLVDIAYESGFSPKPLRSLVCRVLRRTPDSSNWSDFPNVDGEVRDLLRDCAWYNIYDIVEEIAETLAAGGFVANRSRGSVNGAALFAREINRYFIARGIGWQLTEQRIEYRGPEAFEKSVRGAQRTLEHVSLPTAAGELHEAITDLSRRPSPDITGAIQHCMAALECVARQVSGNEKSTLGEIIKAHRGIFPKPLDKALESMWGFASESGRHLREGEAPSLEEAELVVGIASAVCRYLARRLTPA